MKKPLPFSVFKRANRPCYVVAFKNPQTGKYLPPISTRQVSESAAIQTAFGWFRDGIPQQNGKTIDIKRYSLREMAKDTDLAPDDVDFIIGELQHRGILKKAVLAGTRQDRDFPDFLINFWDYDNSPYVKEKLRKNHGIHRRYCREQSGAVQKYWAPFFSGKLLGEIRRQDIEAFIEYFETLPQKGKSIPKSAKRKNTIIQAGTIALSWAFNKEMVDRDVTQGITWFSGKAAERQILTPELMQAVFKVEWPDERAKLANMLAMVSGMRAGEIQGLRVQDLGKDCLYVRHSWNRQDGLKTTKTNESRVAEVPFPGLMRELLTLAVHNPHRQSMDGYVFWAEQKADKPMEQAIFNRTLREALVRTGMSEKSAKVYTFHGWRHYFTSYMRERVNEKLLKQQTGHKTLDMLDHYSGHRLVGDREKIREAQIETFGNLLPEQPTEPLIGRGSPPDRSGAVMEA
ncbi:tyrosine-type recombinase/integrase [Treponema sp. TIM-1]|uniref:tyrosine-type recombinase/integrase n=1 Tax=Treponema sp. TIM-1 TaxID=2898417 RepID=UPI00397F67CD